MPLLSYDQLISSEFDNDGIFQVDSEIVDPSTCPEIGPDSSASGSEIQALKDCVERLSQRMEAIEAQIGSMKVRQDETHSALQSSMAGIRHEGSCMRKDQAGILDAIEKVKRGLDKFFTYVAFEAKSE